VCDPVQPHQESIAEQLKREIFQPSRQASRDVNVSVGSGARVADQIGEQVKDALTAELRTLVKEFRDASGRLTLDLGVDGPMFQVYASRLVDRCGAARVKQLDGLDQRWWDFRIEGATVTLHSDPFAGILLNIEDGSRDDLLRRVAIRITTPAADSNDNPGAPGQ
jgi:hypothetical protein